MWSDNDPGLQQLQLCIDCVYFTSGSGNLTMWRVQGHITNVGTSATTFKVTSKMKMCLIYEMFSFEV